MRHITTFSSFLLTSFTVFRGFCPVLNHHLHLPTPTCIGNVVRFYRLLFSRQEPKGEYKIKTPLIAPSLLEGNTRNEQFPGNGRFILIESLVFQNCVGVLMWLMLSSQPLFYTSVYSELHAIYLHYCELYHSRSTSFSRGYARFVVPYSSIAFYPSQSVLRGSYPNWLEMQTTVHIFLLVWSREMPSGISCQWAFLGSCLKMKKLTKAQYFLQQNSQPRCWQAQWVGSSAFMEN